MSRDGVDAAVKNVLFVCSCLTDAIVQERGLPFRNVAGMNRATRLAKAVQAAGTRVYLLSSATALRQKWTGAVCHPPRLVRVGRLPVVYAWSLGIPFLSSLLEPVAVLLAVRALCRKRRPALVIAYNYYPATLLGAWLAKWRYGAKMILDIEDVCRPRLADWFGRPEARPLRQLVGRLLLRLGVALCDRTLVPSRRFLASGKITKEDIVVTGCIAVGEQREVREKSPEEPLRVLVSGKLDEEQGVGLVLDAIADVSTRKPRQRALEFHFCGYPADETGLRERISRLRRTGARITYHGMLDAQAYVALLTQADICVAMQNPRGRCGDTKTPSKVYEYLAYGKVVIASDVGDFKEELRGIISLCDYDVSLLADRLREVAEEWEQWTRMGARAAAFARAEYSLPAVGERILRSVLAEGV